MSARTLTVLARARAAPLFALAALVALAALAAATLAPPTSAAPPGDLALTLRLIEDSDNIVPAGGSLQVSATLSSTTADPELDIISGTLRVSGSQEWEHNGRSSYSVATTFMAPVNGAGSGSAVDMQERTTANGGDIVAIGAPNDTVGTTATAGSVRLFVGGDYKMRLTAPTPAANAKFGQSVAVGGGLIVVGAAQNAYVYNEDGTVVATLSPGTTTNVPTGYGGSVAIDDAAATIVVGSTGGHGGVATNGSAYIFTRPTTGWGDADTDDAIAVTSTTAASDAGKMVGSPVAISGDGNTLAVGAPRRDRNGGVDDQQNGGVLVFVKPSGGWAASTAETALLRGNTAADSIENGRMGASVDINADGSVIVAGQAGNYPEIKTTWAGAAYVFARPTAGWTGTVIPTARLSDSDSANGDLFGHDVAINAAGDTVAVSNALKITTTIVTPATTDDDGNAVPAVTSTAYGTGDVHVFSTTGAWSTSTAAGTVLTSPQTDGKVFGGGLAIYGDDTLIVGQTETIAADVRDDDAGLTSGGGRAYSVNLGATDVQASAALINAETLPCSSRLLDGTTTRTCAVDLDTNVDTTVGYSLPMITIPAGTPDGTFTISANFTVTDSGDAKSNITAVLPITIGTVDEAASATFTVAQDPGDPTISGDPAEKPYPTEIAAGENTRLLLRILSSEGKPAGANAVSAVLFTTNQGTLTLLNPVGAATGTCNLTCQVDVSKLNASNSGAIAIQVAHPGAGKSGIGTVRAQVLPRAGSGQLAIDPIDITFSGAASTLTISEAATGVLNVNTASGTGDADAQDARETRDSIRFSVSATDASGNKADVPTTVRSSVIKGPDGTVVWRSSTATGTFEVRWPLTTADGPDADAQPDNVLDSAGNLQVEVDVDAPATAKLKGGVYTLEVKAGSLTGTQTFTVSGGAETIEFSEPDGELTIGGRFTLTATFTDADDAAVPNGTAVTFAEIQSSAAPVVVVVRKGTTTKDGQASATYQVVNTGRVSIRASSGDAGNIALVQVAEVADEEPAAPTNPADSLTPKMPNEYSSWLGEGTTSASDLLDGLGSGFGTILRWYNGEWLRYGVVDGRKIPGAVNFEVTTGAILWLGGSN